MVEVCPVCKQVDHGQTGEYPCPKCGLPTAHDTQPSLRDLSETTWQEFMKTDPRFRVGDTFIYRSKGADYDGYTVAVYERFGLPIDGGADICRKGIFWKKEHATFFADALITEAKLAKDPT